MCCEAPLRLCVQVVFSFNFLKGHLTEALKWFHCSYNTVHITFQNLGILGALLRRNPVFEERRRFRGGEKKIFLEVYYKKLSRSCKYSYFSWTLAYNAFLARSLQTMHYLQRSLEKVFEEMY